MIRIFYNFSGASGVQYKDIEDAHNGKLIVLYPTNTYYIFYLQDDTGTYNIYEIHLVDIGNTNWTSPVKIISDVDECVIDCLQEFDTNRVIVTFTRNDTEFYKSYSNNFCSTWTEEKIGDLE
jgi:hypothetical protein